MFLKKCKGNSSEMYTKKLKLIPTKSKIGYK